MARGFKRRKTLTKARRELANESHRFYPLVVIHLSLDLKNTDNNYEVHDLQILVTQVENQGLTNIVYSSKQVIRSD